MGAMIKMMMVVALATAVMTTAMAGNVYVVGGQFGWTSIGHVNYKSWSTNKSFRVGDTIVFSYNKIFHNVARVTYHDYITCNGSKPYTTFTSGHDNFTIKHPGHYFFICTFSNHCQTGQKVDIRVPVPPAHPEPPIEPLPFPYPQPFLHPPPRVTPPATTPAPVSHSPAPVSHSPAPVSHSPGPVTPSPAPENAPAPVEVPAVSPSPVTSVEDGSSAAAPTVPAPEIAPSEKNNMAGQLGFGLEIWSMMVAVFYLFGFGF